MRLARYRSALAEALWRRNAWMAVAAAMADATRHCVDMLALAVVAIVIRAGAVLTSDTPEVRKWGAILVGLGSTGYFPEGVRQLLLDFSRWCLVIAISALGMKTSLKSLGAAVACGAQVFCRYMDR